MAKMKIIFYGELKNNEFTMNNREMFMKYIGRFADPKDKTKPVRIRMTVEKVRRSRSNEQNRYYWGVVVAMIAEEIGYNPWEKQEVHNALKKAVLGEAGDDRLPISIRTSLLTTLEFCDYVEGCRRWASMNLGIDIPDPTKIEAEYYNEQFMH